MTLNQAVPLVLFLTFAAHAGRTNGNLRLSWFFHVSLPQATAHIASPTPETKTPDTLTRFKDFADSAKSLAEILGLAVGGIWTWRLFIKNRQDYARAKVTHMISHRVLPGGKRLLRLAANVENIGPVILRIDEGFIWIQQILPLPPEFSDALLADVDPVKADSIEYDWPIIAKREWKWKEKPREVEPGEEDHIQFDFVIDAEASLVEIYSYFKNECKIPREIGWDETTVYNFDSGEALAANVMAQARPKDTPPRKLRSGHS